MLIGWDTLRRRPYWPPELHVIDDGNDRHTEAFAARLRELRDTTGIPYNQVAKASGLDRQYLSRMVNGKTRPPSAATVARMAIAFGADPDDLCALAGKMPDEVRSWVLATGDHIRAVRRLGDIPIAQRGGDEGSDQ